MVLTVVRSVYAGGVIGPRGAFQRFCDDNEDVLCLQYNDLLALFRLPWRDYDDRDSSDSRPFVYLETIRYTCRYLVKRKLLYSMSATHNIFNTSTHT